MDVSFTSKFATHLFILHLVTILQMALLCPTFLNRGPRISFKCHKISRFFKVMTLRGNEQLTGDFGYLLFFLKGGVNDFEVNLKM